MRFGIIMAAAAALVATPAAAADFTGPRVGVVGGIAGDDVLSNNAKTYGANVGYDLDVAGAVVGVTGEYQDSKDSGRELSVTARLGKKLTSNTLVYGLAGYTNLGAENTDFNIDGVRVGGGVEVALGRKAFVNVEQRYSNYELGVEGYQTTVGLGLRF